MGGPIPDFGQYTDFSDSLGLFIDNLLKNIKDWTSIDLYWMLDWSWTTNTILDLVRQANDLMAWLQNPIQRPPNLLSRPGFSSPSAIAAAPDWSWDPVVSLGTVEGPYGVLRTDPQGSAMTTADGSRHAMLSNAISEPVALTPGQILVCQVHALVEAGFTASDDQAIRLELVPSRFGVLQDAVVLASCGVPTGDPTDWVAAPVGSKAVFFDVDYKVPVEDSPDTVELRLVVGESAGGDVPVRFDGARVAAAGGFLVVLADLFDAGRVYLTALWDAVTAWLEDVFDADHWTALKTDTDAAFDVFVRQVKRALHHADADVFHPPATSDILSNALKSNPWFGWLFDMVDSWLQPVLLIGKAGTAFWETVWHAITAFAEAPTASGAWSTLMAAINGAWNSFVNAILKAWDPDTARTHEDFTSPGTATMAALRNNDWFGWLFGMIDDWLQPVLKVGKAVVDFGDDLWHAVTAYVANPLASGAWPALVNALNDAWNVAVDAVLNAWGSSKTHADFASPAEATEAAIKNNPVTGWLFGNTFEGGSWLDNALAPITNFFDSIRKYINQMVEPLHWGYFDTNWAWVPALTTPDTQLPGEGPVMTPGSNDGDGGGLAPGADASIPAAPKNVSAIPFWDITVTGFPAGNITYAIAAVKSGVEGPATQVKTYVGTLFPPNSSTHVDLRWDAVSGASSYRVYRKADGYSTSTAWRLVASPTSPGTLLAPVVDKTARSGGTVAAPKTDAELAAQIVTAVKATASTADANAGLAQAAAGAAQSVADDATTAAGQANATAMLAAAKFEALPEANIVINNVDHSSEDWGVVVTSEASGATWTAPNSGGLQPGSVSWTQSVPEGSKVIFVVAAVAGLISGGSNTWTVSLDHPSLAASLASRRGLVEFPGVNRTSQRFIWSVKVPSGFNDDVEITVSMGECAIIDAASIVVGGSASGDFDLTMSMNGTQTAPADSLLIEAAARISGSPAANAPAAFPGFTDERVAEHLSSVQADQTYAVSSRLASRNIDGQIDITYSGNADDQALIVAKSVEHPTEDRVGSFGKMVTTSTAAPPTNTPVGQVLPLNGYYQSEIHSPDLTADLSTASFRVFYTGTYLVEFTVGCSASTGFIPVVLVNGTPESYGGNGAPSATGASYPSGYPILAYSCLVYLNKGDYVSFGVYANSGTPALSRAASIPKHAAISLVNRSYL